MKIVSMMRIKFEKQKFHIKILIYFIYFRATALMTSPTILGWIKRHKMFAFMVAYIILILAIGSSNSSLIYKYYRRLFR